MPQEHVPDLSVVEHWLVTARITALQHWDMLVFLYRHQTSLVSAEHIARLLGYATGEAVAALDHAVRLLLVKRWRRGDRRSDTNNRYADLSSFQGGKTWQKAS